MRIITAAIAAAFVANALPAAADEVDLTTITCKEFLGQPAERQALISMWFTGYTADPDAALVVDFAKAAKDLAELEKACTEDGEQELIAAAENVFAQ